MPTPFLHLPHPLITFEPNTEQLAQLYLGALEGFLRDPQLEKVAGSQSRSRYLFARDLVALMDRDFPGRLKRVHISIQAIGDPPNRAGHSFIADCVDGWGLHQGQCVAWEDIPALQGSFAWDRGKEGWRVEVQERLETPMPAFEGHTWIDLLKYHLAASGSCLLAQYLESQSPMTHASKEVRRL